MKKFKEMGIIGKLWRCSWVTIAVLFGLGLMVDGTTKVRKHQVAATQPEPVKKVKALRRDITYASLAQSAKHLTELKFDALAKEVRTIKPRVEWRGIVMDVEKKTFGGYEVWVNMDRVPVQDVYLDIDSKELAASLRKGQVITYQGDIYRISNILTLFSVRMENVEILK